jgi:hypothetical protein
VEDLGGRGLKTNRKYLFVTDGLRALRAAIDAVFGAKDPCRVTAITRSKTCWALAGTPESPD